MRVYFTGKAADPDSADYLFLFRNYKQELSRWNAADPSGFPDGPNNTLYINNLFGNALDPTGKAITLYRKPVVGGLGESWNHSYVYFDVRDPDDNSIEGTVSGQWNLGPPTFGNLVSRPGSDMASARNDGKSLDWSTAGWSDEYCFYLDLMGAQNAYGDDLEYNADPASSADTDYNSNGYIAGILDLLGISTGYTASVALGWDVPISVSYSPSHKNDQNHCE